MSMQHLAPRLKLYDWTLSGGFQSCGEQSWWQSSVHLCITLFSSQQLCVTLLRHIYTCYKYFLSNKIVRTRSRMQFEPNILAKQHYGHEACHSISSVPFCHSNVCVICLQSVILYPVNPIGASKPQIHLLRCSEAIYILGGEITGLKHLKPFNTTTASHKGQPLRHLCQVQEVPLPATAPSPSAVKCPIPPAQNGWTATHDTTQQRLQWLFCHLPHRDLAGSISARSNGGTSRFYITPCQ